MKVKLLRDARIMHKAGEILDVSPAEASFLTSTESAVEVVEAVKAPTVKSEAKETRKKK